MDVARKHTLLILAESYERAQTYVSEGFVPLAKKGMIIRDGHTPTDHVHQHQRRVSYETWYLMRAMVLGMRLAREK